MHFFYYIKNLKKNCVFIHFLFYVTKLVKRKTPIVILNWKCHSLRDVDKNETVCK